LQGVIPGYLDNHWAAGFIVDKIISRKAAENAKENKK
jgi:hypothetical protein